MRREFYAEYFQIEDRHWWFLGRREIFIRLLDRYLCPTPEDHTRRILDVGCGTGTMLRHLSRYGRVEGIDADPEAVRFSRERGVEHARHVDSLPLPFQDGTFALVTALDVLEHIDDDAAMLAEIHRVLAPAGKLLVSVPAYRFLWGPQDVISEHKRRYVRRELKARLVGAGFEIERLSYFNTLLFPPIAAIRVLRLNRIRGRERSDFELTKPGWLNAVLARLFALEAPLLERLDLPFGVSILGFASRTG
jgi:SAM-dependent methyltransferase